MQRPRLRGLAMAAIVGVVAGGGIGLFTRFLDSPVGLGGGTTRPAGLVAIGSPEGGGGWITLYRGTEETPCARTQVPWQAYNEAIGSARPLPLNLTGGGDQQIVVALGAMPGMTGGCLVVLDTPERGCKPLAWRRLVLGESSEAHELWIGGGDIDGDGKDEIVVGGPKAKGEVIVLDDLAHGLAPLATLRVPWSEYNEACGETRPAVGDLDGDGRAEVVVGLGGWGKRGGCVAVYQGLRFSRWVQFPDREYRAMGGGTWPAVASDGDGAARLLLGTDRGLPPRIAVLVDPLGSAKPAWIDIPAEVSARAAELCPVCADLAGRGSHHVLAHFPGGDEPSAAALFDDAAHRHAFLGWRLGAAPAAAIGSELPFGDDPGARGREAALKALIARRGEVESTRNDDGGINILLGSLSDPSNLPPVDRANEFLRERSAIWGIADPSRDLTLNKDDSVLELDDCDTTHVRFIQTVSGVPLLHHGLAVHMDRTGVVSAVTGEFDSLASAVSIDPNPVVTREAAIDTARQEARAELPEITEPKLVAWRGQGPVHLCWELHVATIDSGTLYLVDAHSGDVVFGVEGTTYHDAPQELVKISARTSLGHPVILDGVREHGHHRDRRSFVTNWTYMWKDQTRPAHIITSVNSRIMSHSWWPGDLSASEGPPFHFDGWVTPPSGPHIWREAAAAHRNLGKILHYWYTTIRRKSYDDRDGLVDLVMTDEPGLNNNASYNAFRGIRTIRVGRAIDSNTNSPLDTLAHEFTHAVEYHTEHAWCILSGEPSIISEHVADAFAVFTEYREKSETYELDRGRWNPLDLWRHSAEGGTPVRDFSLPWDYEVDLLNPSASVDNGYCHRNARILGHWMYLWVHGGDHAPRFLAPESSHVVGMTAGWNSGIERAMRVAERTYWRFLNVYSRGVHMISLEGFRSLMLRCLRETADVGDYLMAVRAFEAIHMCPPYRDHWAFKGLLRAERIANEALAWNRILGATEYRVSVGSTPGGTDLFDRAVGGDLSVRVSGLPTDGRTLYVRFWYKKNGVWHFGDVTSRASGGGEGTPMLTSPEPRSTLSSTTATFTWSAGTGVSQYRLKVGRSAGGSDLADQDLGLALSATVTGLPDDGRALYVEVWFRQGDAWRHVDTMFTCVGDGGGPQDGSDPIPEITSPVPTSTLSSGTAEFSWSAGRLATEYHLQVGSARGGTDLYNRGQGTGLSATVPNLPTDGRRLHVRLWFRVQGRWFSSSYVYTAASPTSGVPPTITSPEPGRTITSSSVYFRWTPGDATDFWLQVGTQPGGRDLFDQSANGTDSWWEVSNIPTDGQAVHVRLWYRRGAGRWARIDARYATGLYEPPRITSPAPGARLTTFYADFEWDRGSNVGQFRFLLGTTPGGNNLSNQDRDDATSAMVTGLPTDGRPLYARLWFLAAGAWRSIDASFAAANSGEQQPAIASPSAGSTLASSTATFALSAGPGAANRVLHYSLSPPAPDDPAPVAENYLSGRGIDARADLSLTVDGLPTDHAPIYVWLTYGGADGRRFHTPYVTYVAAHADSAAPRFSSPAPGSTCDSSTIALQWSAAPGPEVPPGRNPGSVQDAVGYDFWIGSEPRADNTFHHTGTLYQASSTIYEFPLDGRRMYVQSSACSTADDWRGEVVEVSMAGGGSYGDRETPRIEIPPPGATLGSSTVQFTWSAVEPRLGEAVRYHLRGGSIAGANDLFDRDMGTALTGSASGLPTDGGIIYVRVMWAMGTSSWSHLDFVYTAAGGNAVPEITSPSPGSTLTSSAIAFAWSPASGATQYRLRVGSSLASGDLYDHLEGTSRTATVTGLPKDRRPIYVRLSYLAAGAWRDRDFTYSAPAPSGAPSGLVWTWGNGHEGQLGNGGIEVRTVPLNVSGLPGVTAVDAGGRFSLALKGDGTLWRWGWGEPSAATVTPSQVPDITGITAISAGNRHALALKSDGSVWSWGANDQGVLGYEGEGGSVPRQVAGVAEITAITAGYDRSLAVTHEGSVWAWGYNDNGGLGNGTDADRRPGLVPGLIGVTSVAAGLDHSIALKGDGTVWAWGINNHGQLGTNTRSTQNWAPTRAPVQVLGLTGVMAISEGFGHCLALKNDGTVWAWGNNFCGQLGIGTSVDSRVPVQVQGLADVVAIATGCYISVALKSDGTVWAWGNNHYGQLGTATGVPSLVPVRVQGLDGITAVAAGGWHLLALRGR